MSTRVSERAKDTAAGIAGIVLLAVTGYLFVATQGVPLPSFEAPTAEAVEH